MADKCACDNCEHCSSYLNSTRRSFHCKHPDQEYIHTYFREHKISKMPSFIGFGENFQKVPKNKRTPKWCPKLK